MPMQDSLSLEVIKGDILMVGENMAVGTEEH